MLHLEYTPNEVFRPHLQGLQGSHCSGLWSPSPPMLYPQKWVHEKGLQVEGSVSRHHHWVCLGPPGVSKMLLSETYPETLPQPKAEAEKCGCLTQPQPGWEPALSVELQRTPLIQQRPTWSLSSSPLTHSPARTWVEQRLLPSSLPAWQLASPYCPSPVTKVGWKHWPH